MNEKPGKLYIYAAGVEKVILQRCLRPEVQVEAYLYDSVEITKDKICEDEYRSIDEIGDFFGENDYAAACSDFGEVVLKNKGVPRDHIIDISRSTDRLSPSFDRFFIRSEQEKYYGWVTVNRSEEESAEKEELNRWHDSCMAAFLSQLRRPFYIVYDGCGTTVFPEFEKEISGLENYRGKVRGDDEVAPDSDGEAGYEQLLYEDLEDVFICLICSRKRIRKIEGHLLDIGIKKEIIFLMDDVFYHAASKPFDEYDIHLGMVHRQEKNPGFVTFGNEDEATDKTIRIVTLGGSTSDPTYGNIKSWSEILYNRLTKSGLDVILYGGGVSAFSSDHEWMKLIRDGLHLKPDLVISYSGFNNATTLTFDTDHPACKKSQMEFLRSILSCEDEKIRSRWLAPFDNISRGLPYEGTLPEHWLECEHIMHAVCEGFGIAFLGFLQPFNRVFAAEYGSVPLNAEVFGFYEEMQKGGWETDWLVDFTGIFSDKEDMEVFYDVCHQYERSNRIIVKKMMPYVLKELRNKTEK